MDSGKVFEICPHLHGARNLQAPSYSPLTKLYYLGVNNSCMDSTVVSAPYEVDGRIVGTVGVIGPTRMAYDRMVQIVDITSRLVGNVLSHKQ